MTLLLGLAAGAILGAAGAYVLFFSAVKAVDPAGLSQRLTALEDRVRRLER